MWGTKEVSKNNILELISSYDIFKRYISNFVNVNSLFSSELRKDSKPTCCIHYNGDYVYKDYSIPGYDDAFTYVMKMYNICYTDALNLIAQDFNLNLTKTNNININTSSLRPAIIHNLDEVDNNNSGNRSIKVHIRNYNKYDKSYWFDKYGLSVKDLKFHGVYPIEYYYIDDSLIKVDFKCYGYLEINDNNEEEWKIYNPDSDNYKWINNYSKPYMSNYNNLPENGDLLIITKSKKDMMILHKLGYTTIAVQNEAAHIPDEIIVNLKSRFKTIILIYDNDAPGIAASDRMVTNTGFLNFRVPNLDNIKDPSDYVEALGNDELILLLNTFINENRNSNSSMGE